jgi:hypothetical protein
VPPSGGRGGYVPDPDKEKEKNKNKIKDLIFPFLSLLARILFHFSIAFEAAAIIEITAFLPLFLWEEMWVGTQRVRII